MTDAPCVNIDEDDYELEIKPQDRLVPRGFACSPRPDDTECGLGAVHTNQHSRATRNRDRKPQKRRRESREGCKSVLNPKTDPFALRSGKSLSWRGVNMTLASEKGEPGRKLLDGVWGEVPVGETTAILGPSGAGKTSLLNILSGRQKSKGRTVTVESEVHLDGIPVDPTCIKVRKRIAFVPQGDSLMATSTPREAIRFSAKLRLPRSTKDSQIDKLTTRMIAELGLGDCADTYVGGNMVKGISGGERKRTSVGVELVVKPALVFLDEPTSGLDSFSAVQLCQLLKKVAQAGSSVLFTIHQPCSEIFNSFDHLILLNKGRIMYQGAVVDVPRYFAERNQPCPPNYNPADWIMDVAQSLTRDELDSFFLEDNRPLQTPEGKGDAQSSSFVPRRSSSASSFLGSSDHLDHPIEKHRGFTTQLKLLLWRDVLNVCRSRRAMTARFGLSTFMSILVGSIFFQVGQSDSANNADLQSHFGALIMVALLSMFSTAQPSMLAFPEERPVFLREYSTNHYSAFSYFISRLLMEAFVTGSQIFFSVLITYFMIGFQASFGIFYATVYVLAMASTALAVLLGSSVPDVKTAQEFLPILFVPQMLFAGFFVTPSLIPVWLRWARYLCALTYAVRILIVAEFWNCGLPDSQARQNCNELVKNVEFTPSGASMAEERWWYWLALLLLFSFFRLCALCVLRARAKF